MRVTVHIPDELGKQAEALAKGAGKSISALYAEAVEAHVKTLRRGEAIRRINALIGTSEVAPDADEQLKAMRRASDRAFE